MLRISELIKRLEIMQVMYGDLPIRVYDHHGSMDFIENQDYNFIVSQNVQINDHVFRNGGWHIIDLGKVSVLDIG